MVNPVSNKPRAFGVAMAAVLFANTPAAAERSSPIETESSVSFAGARPQAGVAREAAEGQEWTVVSLFGAGEIWVARIVAWNAKGRTVGWADSTSCPALKDQIVGMTRLAPIGLVFSANERHRPPPEYWADAPQYTLWSRTGVQPDGSPIDVTWKASSGPSAEWADATFARLKPCLKPAPPALRGAGR